MTTARSRQIDLDITPYYHCTTTCVRKSFLCGYDYEARRSFEHRKGWIEDLLMLLNDAFCIDVAAYAIMSNHYHVVLKVDKKKSTQLTNLEVAQRWLQIFSGNSIARRFCDGEDFSKSEKRQLLKKIKIWRKELSNISRFMGQINERIARWANKEDGCKGRFWEARFDSQAVLDLGALVRTMIYVDLNPLRAKVTDTPEESRHTSLHRRLNKENHQLLAFANEQNTESQRFEELIPITFDEYLMLLDWSSRELRKGKRGAISDQAPPILERLNRSPDQWMRSLVKQKNWKQKAIGSAESIKRYCSAIGQKWIWQSPELQA